MHIAKVVFTPACTEYLVSALSDAYLWTPVEVALWPYLLLNGASRFIGVPAPSLIELLIHKIHLIHLF